MNARQKCPFLSELPLDVTTPETLPSIWGRRLQVPCEKGFSFVFHNEDVARAVGQFSNALNFTCQGHCDEVHATMVDILRELIAKETLVAEVRSKMADIARELLQKRTSKNRRSDV